MHIQLIKHHAIGAAVRGIVTSTSYARLANVRRQRALHHLRKLVAAGVLREEPGIRSVVFRVVIAR